MGLWTAQGKSPGRKNLSPAGFSVLTFESKQNTQHHGITRFKLTKADEQRKTFSTWFHVELVVDLKVIEELPETVQKFPWAYTLTEPVASQGQPDAILQDPAQVQLSLQHCVSGDYLTLYTRGIAHPVYIKIPPCISCFYNSLKKGMETILGLVGRHAFGAV
jgi:hypothetical protein